MEHQAADNSNLYVTITTAAGSAFGFLWGLMTPNNIAFLIATIAGVISIYVGLLTVKEKRLIIKRLKEKGNER